MTLFIIGAYSAEGAAYVEVKMLADINGHLLHPHCKHKQCMMSKDRLLGMLAPCFRDLFP